MLGKCQVCNKENVATEVACSVTGPVSFAYCATCYTSDAEPFWTLEYILESTEGDIADWVKELITFHDGKYISWDEFVKLKESS